MDIYFLFYPHHSVIFVYTEHSVCLVLDIQTTATTSQNLCEVR